MDFFQEQISFFIAIAFLLFFPGYVLLRSVFDKHTFYDLEIFVISVPASIAIVNFLMILLAQAGVRFDFLSIAISILSFTATIFLLSLGFRKYQKKALESAFAAPVFTKTEGWLLIAILTLTIFIKTVYLSHAIIPTATDLGHHMYWAKVTAETGTLPTYAKQDIIKTTDGYALSAPEPIDDFIIGEHLVFAAIALLSGLDFISTFPSLVLLLANLFTLLAIFIFLLRAFPGTEKTPHALSGKRIAFMALFLLGPLYTIASPQAKFVSGGVIGNIFGNVFIPVLLFLYWRALKEKKSPLLALAFFLTFGLAYIHHLSTLMFLFIALCSAATFIILHLKKSPSYLKQWAQLFFSPAPLVFFLLALLFFFYILAPSYADPKSIDTALGSPSKATRTGLTFLQLTLATGEGKIGLGLIGIILLFFGNLRTRYASAFFIGWGAILFVMSLRPQWLFIDIPSNRISTYATFPFAILAAISLALIFLSARNKEKGNTFFIPQTIIQSSFIIILTFLIVGGFRDNAQSLSTAPKSQEAVQTFFASSYLARHNLPQDILLKDHNYIVADSWMKLFFLRDYSYPLSRGYFQRYEDQVNQREQCTLFMISTPNTPDGMKCFNDTGTNIIIINPHLDSEQFRKSTLFSSVYQSDDIGIYTRKSQ